MRALLVRETSLHSMRSLTLSQCRDLKIWLVAGVTGMTEFESLNHSPGKSFELLGGL